MKKFKYLIVGGGVAGHSAAEKIRQIDPKGSIAIAYDESYRLYSRVLLTPYLKGQVAKEGLFIKREDFYTSHKIDFLTNKLAVKLDPNLKIVYFSDGDEISYEKLLIATGGSVKKLTIPGSEKEGTYYLRTLNDAQKIVKGIKSLKKSTVRSQTGLVVGGGFIGLEFTGSFVENGLKTKVLVRDPFYWSKFLDESSGRLIQEWLGERGVEFINGDEIKEFKGGDFVELAITKNVKEIPCSIVGVGVGLQLNTDWLKDSGMETNAGIFTNEYLETNREGVFAAGDIAEFYDVIFEKTHRIGNWTNSTMQGRVAGENMAGGKKVFETVSYYSITCLGLSISFVGDVALDHDSRAIWRGSIKDKKYGRILIKDGRVFGATLINRIEDTQAIVALIKNKFSVSGSLNNLSDPSFSLRDLR